jgi:hypothetical protein
MATKMSVVLEDDLDGGPGDETIRFAVEGTEYEIDLNKKNAAALRKRGSDIRAWAKEQGIAVSGRGRIPASVVEQYEAAAKGR